MVAMPCHELAAGLLLSSMVSGCLQASSQGVHSQAAHQGSHATESDAPGDQRPVLPSACIMVLGRHQRKLCPAGRHSWEPATTAWW